MNFSLRRIGKENIYYHESGPDSEVQLVFAPGCFNPKLWKQQLKYFSSEYQTISFQPTESFRGFEGEKKALENILDQREMNNAVIISNILGNPVLQELENHRNVVATVMNGAPKSFMRAPPKNLYRLFWALATKKPKIMKKFLFSDYTKYDVVKEFADELEVPKYRDFRSFADNYSINSPSKSSMTVYAEDDRFSCLEKSDMPGKTALSIIKRAGTFNFYEKPQEYNKALNDYLVKIHKELETEEIQRAKEENRSLLEFERGEKRKVKVRK